MSRKSFHQFDSNCENHNNDKRGTIVLTDIGKSQYKVFNPNKKRVSELKVDGCLIKIGERCDYLLLVSNDSQFKNKDAYFVELKGSDLMKAISQIDASIETLKGKLNDFKRVFGRIVLTKNNVPDLNNTAIIKLRNKLKKMDGNLIYRVKLEEQI
ncbi:hypothetical protein [Emticicia sp. 21SJ11W-3]|uniref:hypothetical protein n=1 Tax=Emticicia sp. 21SJ11W-3 TaxID=2916755 RepID=UPI00209F7341|nr:hypothetical protein [Emticicia sp. 21SJ11W-3]UTA69165.1 hypothetical protein MB380_05020 [Emticicia sp. 21SJ11W-3]